MKKILTYSMLIVALNLSGAEGESEYPQQSGSGERKTEVKTEVKRSYNAVSTRTPAKYESVSLTRGFSRQSLTPRTLNRVNLRRPTTSVTSRGGSVGGVSNSASSL